MNYSVPPAPTPLLLISLLVFGALTAGCGKKDDPAPAPTSTPTSVSQSSPTPAPGANSASDDNDLAMKHAKSTALALMMYTQDTDEKMPSKNDWATSILPYLKAKDDLTSPHHPGVAVGFAFNSALSGLALAAISAPAQTIELFETTLNSPSPSDGGESWWSPSAGAKNASAYADGHEQGVDQKPDPKAFNPTQN